jgi:hypothetical protein
MKKMILAILLFFAAVFWMLNSYFNDIQINKYPALDAVKEDKAIEKGWIPALLPDSAYDIEEPHDLDTNQLFGKFSYKEKDEAVLLQRLQPMPESTDTLIWENFLFKVDKARNLVRYRNRPVR